MLSFTTFRKFLPLFLEILAVSMSLIFYSMTVKAWILELFWGVGGWAERTSDVILRNTTHLLWDSISPWPGVYQLCRTSLAHESPRSFWLEHPVLDRQTHAARITIFVWVLVQTWVFDGWPSSSLNVSIFDVISQLFKTWFLSFIPIFFSFSEQEITIDQCIGLFFLLFGFWILISGMVAHPCSPSPWEVVAGDAASQRSPGPT